MSTDREGSRGPRRGGIQDVNGVRGLDDPEVVHQRALARDGLGANARAAEKEPRSYQFQASYAEEARSLNQAGMLFSWFGPTT